jgi:hypothetical protein
MTSLVSGYDLPPSVLINGKSVGNGVSKYDDKMNEKRERDLVRLLDSRRNERGEISLSEILKALDDFHSGRGAYAHVDVDVDDDDDDDEEDDEDDEDEVASGGRSAAASTSASYADSASAAARLPCPLGTYSSDGLATSSYGNNGGGGSGGCRPCPEGETTVLPGSTSCRVLTVEEMLGMFYDLMDGEFFAFAILFRGMMRYPHPPS